MGPPPSPGEAARGGRGPIEYRVRLTHVASINPEYDVYLSFPDLHILNRLLGLYNAFYKARRVMTTQF
jgi:hypothetical protein